ncbi:hypothetical protein GCM10029964_097160 [Kibdelosporangium lantanae]
MVNLAEIDDSGSGVTGPLDFTKLSYEDTRTALTRLEEVIIPAVRAGAGVDRMRELDAQAGLADHPASYVRTYEGFFGSTGIKLACGPDGRFTVVNGNHRIRAARDAGVDALPVVVKESDE